MEGTLEERLAAVERAVTDGEHDCSALAEGAAAADRVADLEAELAELTDRVAELEAATQALRGYVGNVRSVNSEVEQRADLALSKAEAARRAVDRTGTSATEPDENPAAQSADADRTGSPERCDCCDRPLDDGPERARPSRRGTDAGTSRLDALADRDAGRIDERDAAGAQTDGGVAHEDRDSGVLARVRALL